MSMHQTDSRWIVISEKNAWGSSPDLKEALSNAGLREYTALDHFEGYLYEDALSSSPLRQAMDDWFDYGHEEYTQQRHDRDPVACVIVYFDADLWEGWEVSPFDGGVSLHGYKGNDNDARRCMDSATLKAYWHQGIISHRND